MDNPKRGEDSRAFLAQSLAHHLNLAALMQSVGIHPDSRAAPAPSRQLVLFLDGTGNTLTGNERDTNVLRLFEHLARDPDPRRLLYYDPGVGSPDALPFTGPLDWLSHKWRRLVGLAVGRGVYENLGQAYAFLMRNWKPGDEIYVFGFSRGAFSARCVAGMVHLFGILRPEHECLIDTLIRVYFSPRQAERQLDRRQWTARAFLGLEREAASNTRTRERIAEQVRTGFASPQGRDAWVHFIGVWDTVQSVGMPLFRVRITSDPTIQGKRMRHVRHALALDEHRLPFRPRLYSDANFGEPGQAQSLTQLWFRGAHSDVGGGYANCESGLSDRALKWMADEAQACGLSCATISIDPPARAVAHDPTHTAPWWAVAGLTLRDTRRPDIPAHESVAQLAAVTHSVWRGPVRSWLALVLAALGSCVGAYSCGRLLLGGAASASLTHALGAYQALALAQFASLCLAPFGDWRSLWASVPHESVNAALAADLLVIASYSYILGRLSSWSFATCADWRRAGQPLPRWRLLGLSLAIAVGGDVAKTVLTIAALNGPTFMQWWQGLALWLAGLACAAKWCGLGGCAVLGAMGVIGRLGPGRVMRPRSSKVA